MKLSAIILAAGKGTRMKSDKAKVLHEICFKPILHYPVRLAQHLRCKKIIAVVGYQKERIQYYFSDYERLSFATQSEQLGTGHATKCALDMLDDTDENILIVCGDSPLLSPDTVTALYNDHVAQDAVVSILTAAADDPYGYGRIIHDENSAFLRIVEEKDATDDERMIDEINTGTYIVKRDFLIKALNMLKNNNSQSEYYLTDITSIAVQEGARVTTLMTGDFFEAMGINSREDLALAGLVMQAAINTRYLLDGVTIIDPGAVYIEAGLKIGKDTVINPGVMISGDTTIGESVTIGAGAIITDSTIGSNVDIKPYSVIEGSVLEDNTAAGPFARIRPGTTIKEGAKIGNFVEIKNSTLGEGSKAGHLTYLGDADIGADVNIGAGTITCNYDGTNKHKTTIKDFSFIGSNTSIVAPVTIEEGAIIGAGAVITKDVPKNMIAVERSTQRHYKKRSKDK